MFGNEVALVLASFVLAPCVVGLIYFNKFNPACKVFALFCVFEACCEALMITIAFTVGHNLYVPHFTAIGEISLLSLFFIRVLGTRQEKRIIQIIVLALCIFALIYASIGNNLIGFNSPPRALEAIYFCGLSCYLFYRMSIDSKIRDEGEGIYFIVGAVFFYFASNFVVFAFSKYKETDNHDLLIMFNIHSMVDSLCNLAYARGLWMASRSRYSLT
jgi:hypothetical protein